MTDYLEPLFALLPEEEGEEAENHLEPRPRSVRPRTAAPLPDAPGEALWGQAAPEVSALSERPGAVPESGEGVGSEGALPEVEGASLAPQAALQLPLLRQHRRLSQMTAHLSAAPSRPQPAREAPGLSAPSQTALTPGQLDRLFQRDARRYDGGFTLF